MKTPVFRFFFVVLTTLLCFLGNEAKATMMVDTWSAVISGVFYGDQALNSGWSAGQKIEVSYIYKDDTWTYTAYTDGINKVAEFGNGDDGIFEKRYGSLTTYNYWADAIDFNTNFTIPDSYKKYSYDVNTAYVYELVSNGRKSFQAIGDGIKLFLHSADNNGYMNWADANNNYNAIALTDITLSTKAYNSAPVPEPVTVLLMGTGLVGLVASRRRKNA